MHILYQILSHAMHIVTSAIYFELPYGAKPCAARRSKRSNCIVYRKSWILSVINNIVNQGKSFTGLTFQGVADGLNLTLGKSYSITPVCEIVYLSITMLESRKNNSKVNLSATKICPYVHASIQIFTDYDI